MRSTGIIDNVLRWGAQRAEGAVDEVLDWVNERTLRLAVTGLSGAGKTIFTTALVHNLIRFPGRPQILPAIADFDNIISVIERPQPNSELATFPYLANLEALTADPPRWPLPPTSSRRFASSCTTAPTSWLRRQVNRQAVLNIDIVDYPGEWLLDLPLLDLTYEAWSAKMLRLTEREPRRRLADEWLAAVASVKPAGPVDELEIRRLAEVYRQYLKASAEPALGLTLIQPGRFIRPGHWDLQSPALNFCPLPAPTGATPGRRSLYAAMAGRYEIYRSRVVRRVLREAFQGFRSPDRAGRSAAQPEGGARRLQRGARDHGHDPGQLRAWPEQLAGPSGPSLGPAQDRPGAVCRQQGRSRLAQPAGQSQMPLQDLLDRAGREIKAKTIQTKVLALAAMRCTADRVAEADGHRLSVVVGIPVGGSHERVLWTGEVPDRMPARGDWDENDYRFIDFLPKRVAPGAPQGFEHIRLDEAIRYLIGDRLA